jgi:hypothetical protein
VDLSALENTGTQEIGAGSVQPEPTRRSIEKTAKASRRSRPLVQMREFDMDELAQFVRSS